MTRQLRVAFLSGLFLLSSLAMVLSVRAQSAPLKKPPQPVSDQMTNIPYFTLRDGMSSTLTLNNLAGLTPTKVKVTIFNTQGKGQELPPITLDPASVTEINLADVVVGDDFDSGNIEVAYSGAPMVVLCQVSIFSVEKRLSFESREQDMMDFMSSSMNGIVWLPQAGAEGFLAVTNAAKNRVTVQLTVESKKEDISLFPRETRLLKLNDELGKHAPVAAVVKLQHNGVPGDVIATGFVLDSKHGYSSSFAMLDPAIMRSSTLAGVHFRFGKPEPSEGFPEGTEFRSPLLLANVSAAPVTAHVSVGYTVQEKLEMTRWETRGTQKDPATQDKFSNVAVKDVTIAPGDVQRIELSEELARLGVRGPVEEAGVDIKYNAAPGSVIGHLVSLSQNGDYSFEVPIKDPSAVGEMIESGYPWTIENGVSTVVHLKNTTGDSASALVLFAFPGGGTYNPDRIVLEPHQSVAIDIQKLKDSGKRDLLKQVFPEVATRGQVLWHQEIPNSMIGRAEETNVKGGTARSFSCNTGCCDYYYVWGFNLSPTSLSGVVGGSGTVSSTKDYEDCYQRFYPAEPATAFSWSTYPTGVATATSGINTGQVSYVGGGATTLTGVFHSAGYYLDQYFSCRRKPTDDVYGASANVTVSPPTAQFSVKLSGSKTSGDSLLFSRAPYDCSENLGLQNCSSIWLRNFEAMATVSDDASHWSVSQQLTGRVKGKYVDSNGVLQPFDDPINNPADNPSSTFLQAPSGQQVLFYIDTPGTFKTRIVNNVGRPVDSVTLVYNFSGSVCSNNYSGDCSNVVMFYVKIVVNSGGILDTTNSVAGLGSLSLNF